MDHKIKSAIVRFVRVLAPQVPTFLAITSGAPAQVQAGLLCAGAFVTALDKLFRDLGWYL